jgi:cytochrome bd-type quinol oxidase subunit 1
MLALYWAIVTKEKESLMQYIFKILTFGKTWRPKLRVVHWNYTVVIRLVLTYSFIIWWPGVRYNCSKTELNKLQSLACLAMMTTPTAAVEFLLALPPLHVMKQRSRQGSTD